MSFFKVLIIIGVLIYILSPVDLIPDILPISGWLDDAFLLGILLYYLKRGRLPEFLSWLKRTSTDHQNRHQGFYRQGQGFDPGAGVRTQDPYEVLGLKAGASAEEVRAAYRRAVHAYHPDKVSHLGPELQELAEKKFVEIQTAYEKLVGKKNT